VKSYFDTSVLVKLYIPEEDSGATCAFVQKRGESIVINSLQETELKNAFALKTFRHDISNDELTKLLDKIRKDFTRNRLVRVNIDWIKLWEMTRDYSLNFTEKIGCRTLDILHVAAAKIMKAEEFFTNDKRQKELAQMMEIKAYLSVGIDPE